MLCFKNSILFISTFVPKFRMSKMEQSLWNDLELDVQELKYLVNAVLVDNNQVLSEVAKRSVLQMRSRLDLLYQELSSMKCLEEISIPFVAEELIVASEEENEYAYVKEPVENTVVSNEFTEISSQTSVSDILRTDLRRSISLNDSFRFNRELFRGDSEWMNKVIRELDAMNSLDEAVTHARNEIGFDEDNEAAVDFIELLKKRFS